MVKLIKAHAVKPDLIRCDVEICNADGVVTSTYQIVVNTLDFTQQSTKEGVTEMRIDLTQLQILISQQITQMGLTGGIANALNVRALEWDMVESDDTVPTDSESGK